MMATITGDLEHLHLAQSLAQAFASLEDVPPMVDFAGKMGLALCAVLNGDGDLAMEQYPDINQHQGTMYWWISADRVLGLLCSVAGILDDAIAHHEDALGFCRKAGYLPELAWACYDCAVTLIDRSQNGDRDRADSLLGESLMLSEKLGMKPLRERSIALRSQLESLPAKAPTYPDGLTHREVEVLLLVAAGKTDREIADALVISVRTVGRHVSNILAKTNTNNRAEAATYAATHGLVES